jgi:heme exporter protein C
MIWKAALFIVMTFVIVAGIAFPIVDEPEAWYEFPYIAGLGENAKIIFFHVPTAWLAGISFLMATFFGIRYLKTKDLVHDTKSLVSLQIGMVFVLLATITGSVWAKFAWGSFWHWDPRETSVFALLLIYGALFALRSAIENDEKKASLSAVYSIIAFLTVPFFIFIMPRIMVGLHPGSADDTTSGPVVNFHMNGNMLLIFFLSLAAFTILFFWIWNLAFQSYRLKETTQQQLN